MCISSTTIAEINKKANWSRQESTGLFLLSFQGGNDILHVSFNTIHPPSGQISFAHKQDCYFKTASEWQQGTAAKQQELRDGAARKGLELSSSWLEDVGTCVWHSRTEEKAWSVADDQQIHSHKPPHVHSLTKGSLFTASHKADRKLRLFHGHWLEINLKMWNETNRWSQPIGFNIDMCQNSLEWTFSSLQVLQMCCYVKLLNYAKLVSWQKESMNSNIHFQNFS